MKHPRRARLGAAPVPACTLALAAALALPAIPLAAQDMTSDDPVIAAMWAEGMENSQAYDLAQTLLDSIGPRLTGTPQQDAAHEWIIDMYESWGISAEKEQYGTWLGWERGITHIDLVEPRVRTLEGMMLAWTGDTDGEPVEAEVVTMPVFESADEVEPWLETVQGKFVAISYPQPTCRPDDQWREYAAPGSFERMDEMRRAEIGAWNQSAFFAGPRKQQLHEKLEAAGAAGILESRWSRVSGTNKVFSGFTKEIPAVDIGCEDYGLVFRLAENGQSPVLRITAESEFLGEVPTFNTIARIEGSERPDEYIVLSAHFDSWDGGSGATDNGTGTVTMLEAMRIIAETYPNPKRTIIAGHWSGEEQGLNGSRAWAADHPEVVEGLQALFNQDNGTGRVVNISMQGLPGAAPHFADWLSEIPTDITRHIDLVTPGTPGGGGSDYAAFVCYGAPAFSLSSLSWGYGSYTWHTQRDTFDKLVMDDVMNNATLTAMLTYLASEDPETVSRERRAVMPEGRDGQPRPWPTCRDGARSFGS